MRLNNKHLVALAVDGEPWYYLDNVEIVECGSIYETVINDDGQAQKRIVTGPFMIDIKGTAICAKEDSYGSC